MAVEFDRYAAEYDQLLRDPIRDGFAGDSRFFHERKWLLIKDFFARRRTAPGSLRWLDIGCGRGELLQLGAPYFAEAVGCDPAIEMINSARVRTVHQVSPTALPFESGSFDFVTAVCVFHHVPPQDQPLLTAEIARVLRPNGIACIIEHNPRNPITRLIVSRTPVDANAQLLTGAESESLLVQAGLTPEETRFFLYLPKPLFRFAGRLESLLARVPLGGQYAAFARKRP